MTNEIIILDDTRQITPTDLFTSKGIEAILDEIKKKARDFQPDVTTEEGRKEIASRAYKVARTKTALDNEGKKLTEEWARQKSLVDSERKKVREELDALRDEIRAPLNEYEEREEKRVNERKERILQIEAFKTAHYTSNESIKLYEESIKKVNELQDFDWQEFEFKAKNTTKETLEELNKKLDAAKEQAAKDAELERLRKAEEERKRKEREDQIAKEAAEKAKQEAEAKALAEKERIANEQKKKDEEAQRAKEKAEREAKEREAKIEADRKAAEQAKIDAEKRAKEAEERAEIAAKEAAEKERKRIEDEKKAEEAAIAKREANKRHCAKINNEAVKDLMTHVLNDKGVSIIDEDTAKRIIASIARSEIKNISINY